MVIIAVYMCKKGAIRDQICEMQQAASKTGATSRSGHRGGGQGDILTPQTDLGGGVLGPPLRFRGIKCSQFDKSYEFFNFKLNNLLIVPKFLS